MQAIQAKLLGALHAVQAFLAANATALASVVATGARQKLEEAIADLSVHASKQSGSRMAAQGSTRKQQTLRRALMRDHMAPIASIAQAELPDTPELAALRLPTARLNAERLVAQAKGMAEAAAPFADVFIAAALPKDFIPQLNTAADALLSSLNERKSSRAAVSGATTSLKVRLASARKTLKVIDTLVKSALKDDPGLLSEWNSVKRVEQIATQVSHAA